MAFISHGNIRTRYHCNYDGFHLNDKGATLLTKNVFSALNKVAWPQCVKVNSSSKSFSDYDHRHARRNAFTSTKSIKAKQLKNLFFSHTNAIHNKFFSAQELIKETFDIEWSQKRDFFINLIQIFRVVIIFGKSYIRNLLYRKYLATRMGLPGTCHYNIIKADQWRSYISRTTYHIELVHTTF